MRTIAKYLISAALLLAGCSYPSHEEFEERPHGTISVAHLKTLCREGSTTITDDISIEAYVVANDLYGEYLNAVILCDESGGIELSLECDNTAAQFPISARVVVHCTGLALGSYGGEITLGAPPTGSYRVERIAERDFDRYLMIDREQAKEIKPKKITIAELAPSHIGNYIALEDVTFGEEAGLCWCDTDAETGEAHTTIRTLRDREGNSLQVRAMASCTYGGEEIPAGYGTVWGVVEYSSGSYLLRIVNHRIDF
ncbi:MAG: hypothetical protein IKU22_08360 [Alistipes sp.]|nr:hypothetical protein [Alistipes sp.]